MAQANLSIDWATNFCSQLPDRDGDTCFANSTSRLIEVDSRNIPQAVELCENAKASGHDTACYEELLKFSTYTFTHGSPEFYELCNTMPEPWGEQCLAQTPSSDTIFN